MKLTKQKFNKRTLTLASLGAILLIGGAVFALGQIGRGGLSNKDLTEAADQTSTVQPEQANDTNSGSREGGAELPQKPPYQDSPSTDNDTGANESRAKPEQPRVTRAEQSGDVIKVTALFQRNSSGSCELHLGKQGRPPLTRTADIIVGPSYYACGFSLPRNTLPVGGSWQAVVTHHVGDTSAASEAKTIQVK